MRVPIFSKDLESGKGVLRLARCLQRDWPGKNQIKLSTAQNLMSRCLGYVDFHDVRVSADCADPVFPSLEDVQAQSFATIKTEIAKYYRPADISDEDIYARICKWPFIHLHAFRTLSGGSGVKLSEEALQLSKKTTLHYRTLVSTTALDANDFKTIFERVRSAFGHNSKELTMSYIKKPIGYCRSYDDIPATSNPLTECPNCGPASFNISKG